MKVAPSKGSWTLDTTTTKPIAKGGEAAIYDVPGLQNFVAKVYHNPTRERARKLKAMLSNPPDTSSGVPGRPAVAWPTDLLTVASSQGAIAGYVMPRITGAKEVFKLYVPKSRMQFSSGFNYKYLVHTARNVASATHSLHKKGYVLGDINESNILVSPDALITIIDADSFQVRDLQGHVHRCPVGKDEFTPRELQGLDLSTIDRSIEHDNFGLAVILFKLLMEGLHPFDGRYLGSGNPPLLAERIRSGSFPYSKSCASLEPVNFPSIDILGPDLKAMFLSAFEKGNRNPSDRPAAEQWFTALCAAETSLTLCSKSSQHYYHRSLRDCPWCQRASATGIDLFPQKAGRSIKQTTLPNAQFLGQAHHGATAVRPQRVTHARPPTIPSTPPVRPATASPPISYRVGQFAGRQKVGVIWMACAALILLAGYALPSYRAWLVIVAETLILVAIVERRLAFGQFDRFSTRSFGAALVIHLIWAWPFTRPGLNTSIGSTATQPIVGAKPNLPLTAEAAHRSAAAHVVAAEAALNRAYSLNTSYHVEQFKVRAGNGTSGAASNLQGLKSEAIQDAGSALDELGTAWAALESVHTKFPPDEQGRFDCDVTYARALVTGKPSASDLSRLRSSYSHVQDKHRKADIRETLNTLEKYSRGEGHIWP